MRGSSSCRLHVAAGREARSRVVVFEVKPGGFKVDVMADETLPFLQHFALLYSWIAWFICCTCRHC